MVSDKTLDVKGHRPSPLAGLPHYVALHETVERAVQHLPAGMALVGVIKQLRGQTWQGLKDILSK